MIKQSRSLLFFHLESKTVLLRQMLKEFHDLGRLLSTNGRQMVAQAGEKISFETNLQILK